MEEHISAMVHSMPTKFLVADEADLITIVNKVAGLILTGVVALLQPAAPGIDLNK